LNQKNFAAFEKEELQPHPEQALLLKIDDVIDP
jgi:hypothetical protein